jgi:TrwC relaxase
VTAKEGWSASGWCDDEHSQADRRVGVRLPDPSGRGLGCDREGHVPLASYYAERGEAPGVWIGSGMAGIDGLTAGDPVTAEQMQALFGVGLHPLAAQRQQQLQGPDLSSRDYQFVTRLGAPFKIYNNDIPPFRVDVAKRIADLNAAAGLPRDWPIPRSERARIRTEVATELFRRRARQATRGCS